MNDPAIRAVHQLIQRATRAEEALKAILAGYATMSHGERVSLDQLAAPLNTALIRAEGQYWHWRQDRDAINPAPGSEAG